ncbi:hypothetical protein PFICI_10672 [Pestalotiopsis fici W106-1]|uniref:Major facilitator superfamily (MFS) profile domain-containing protein n=1 Tax=Pestalotiopsis fici (strain W106-1 / CGMCC3.15140) TaxID=1229662 RepID=W3WXP4_PESFW|nr:uncharacterized protein PFICI_10672 [Pestalotiopsis fici W106-1]ETS78610.1 hypothetical protein PFICI_10672 [Pestalotiopsis fici W106-1]
MTISRPEQSVTASFRDVPNNTNKYWWFDASLRINVLHCVGLCGTLFFNGYDGSLFNGLQSISQWQEYFGYPDPSTLGLMNSAGFLPGLIASFFGDAIARYLGRRWSVWIGSMITAVGAIVMGISANVGVFCAGRAITGFGTSTAVAVAPTLLQEISHPRIRAQVSGFYTCIYYIAAILSACVCLGCMNLVGENSWRIPCFLQLVGPIATLLLTVTIPESPRWLILHGHHEKARKILVVHHANGKDDDPLVNLEYREICAALDEEAVKKQTRYLDLVRGRGNIHRLAIALIIAVGTNWVGNGIVSYYLSPILASLGIHSTSTQLEILIGLHVWNLIVSTLAAFYADHVGRRPLWLSSTGGMLVMFCIVMGLSAGYDKTQNTAIGAAAIPFLFLFYGAYDLAWTPLAYSYPVEIFPFSLRTKGQAIFIATQTLAVSVNTWVNPIALDALEWRYYAVYIAILAVLLVVIYFLFPETKNLTLEEISLVFDKESAVKAARESPSADVERVLSIREDSADKTSE